MEKIKKNDDEWKKQLSDEQFEVARKKGTERAFTGAYWDNHEKGTYRCICCGNELFSSDTKFDSGTGWPSFYAPVAADNVETETDNSYGMRRVEAHVQQVRRPFGPCLRRRAQADESALLHQFGVAQVRKRQVA